MFKIRLMTIEDYDTVIRLMKGTEGVSIRDADSRESTLRYLERNPGLSFIAEVGGATVGCLMAGHDGRLEVVDADFGAWDMSGDGEYGNAASMAVKEAVDQVQVSRAATSTADRELPRQMRLDTGGEGCAFLMLAR